MVVGWPQPEPGAVEAQGLAVADGLVGGEHGQGDELAPEPTVGATPLTDASHGYIDGQAEFAVDNGESGQPGLLLAV